MAQPNPQKPNRAALIALAILLVGVLLVAIGAAIAWPPAGLLVTGTAGIVLGVIALHELSGKRKQ